MYPVNLSSLNHYAAARFRNDLEVVARANDLHDLAIKIESFLQIPALDPDLLSLSNGMGSTGRTSRSIT